MVRTIRLALLLVAIVIVQTTILPYLRIAGVVCELGLIATVAVAYREGPESGAIFGLLLAFGMLYPHEKIMLFLLPIPMPAWLFVTGYALVELFLGVTGTQSDVAHFAHLGGLVGGYLLIQYWRGKFPIKPKRCLMR